MIYTNSVLEGTETQRELDRTVQSPSYIAVVPVAADHTVVTTDHNVWYDCDTDTASGDVTLTVSPDLPTGFLMHFSKKGTGGNVVIAAGSGVTLRGAATLEDEDKAASLFITAENEALILGPTV